MMRLGLSAARLRIPAAFLALIVLACAAPPLHALDPAQSLRLYGQQLWQTDNGLPQNTIHAIRQTQDGYLWLSTEGGLVRFDGVDFTLFDRRSAPQLRSNLIGALTETADGTLWAATADGLVRRSQGSLQVLGTANGLPAGPIAGVIAAGPASLWVLTPEGVAFGSENRFVAVTGLDAPLTGRDGTPIAAGAPDGSLWLATAHNVVQLRDGRIVTMLPASADLLAVAHDSSVWLTRDGSLFHYQRGVLTPILLGEPVSGKSARGGVRINARGGVGSNARGGFPAMTDNSIRALCAGGSGTLYVAIPGALGIRSPAGAFTWKTARDGLPANRVLHLFEDRRGALWISTEDSVSRYARGRFETLHARSGAAGVETFYEDREGNLWLGTDAAGLLELREQRFTTFTTADGLPGDVIRTILADKDSVWAGTDGNGLARLHGSGSGSAWQVLTTQQGLASNTILSLAAGRDGSLTVGTPDGLDHLLNGRAAPAQRSDTLPDDFVRSLLYDPADDSLWIGTRRGLTRQTPTGLTLWSRGNGLGSDLVGALARDRSHPGALWIGTRGGLSHLENGQMSTITTRDGLPSNVITALYQDASGSLWIGTNGGGLSLLRDGHVTAFPTSTGLPEVIHAILEDGRGNLWLGAATGIYRAPLQQLNAFAGHTGKSIDVSAYGVADGMRINECSSGHPAAVRTPDGTLWFATLRGISVTNPEQQQENRLPPPVVIENVTIDDQPAPSTKSIAVQPSHTRLALHYAGLSFVAPARVRYRYQLVGFDTKWIDAGARRVAYYTNIPPGRYTFHVLAANNDGVWNDTGATLDIRVLPQTWQTWWFRTLLGLAVLLLGYQAYRMRVHNVELRFNAVLAERTRIAREIHDTLAQDIVGIGVQLELVSRLLGSSIDAARGQLDAARGLVKSSLAEARSSIWNLRSAAAADDLPARVNRAVTQAAANSSSRLRFHVRGTYRAAPSAVEDQLLRVSQEAMNNAVHHSSASTINVTLGYDARAVELSIDDDGRGFTYDPGGFVEGGHFGLRGMEERAAEIGGILHIDTGPAKGTRISLRVDIP
ncbi:MAG TPA: two-component regulator propeller domain-containing protein [Acidobacteriaceae bacterium]|jgi:signal transduction histidine kinase